MIPILFEPFETAYETHGLGELSEATSCEVVEEANGAYTLTLEIPITARHYPDIARRCQILARPNPTDRPQPFRIFRVTRPLRGAVTVFARHLSYDLTGIVIGPFTANSAAAAVAAINAGAINTNPFTLSTNLTASGELKATVPTSARALLGPVDRDGTLLRSYGGDLYFDRYAVQLLQHRGAGRGFEIAYGVNMTELRADEDSGEVYAGILPYWTDGETTVQGDVQSVPASTGLTAIQPVDLSAEFSSQPTVAQLNAHGAAWLDRNKPYLPRDSYQVSFVPPGSRGLHTLEQLNLFDEVTVRYDRLGVRVKKTVVKTTYDVLRERYRSVELGERRQYVSDLLAAPITSQRLAPGAVGRQALSLPLKDEMKNTADTATEANTKATTAKNTADNAKDRADAAYSLASTAKDTADNAATAAADANTLAATASSTANTAKDESDANTEKLSNFGFTATSVSIQKNLFVSGPVVAASFYDNQAIDVDNRLTNKAHTHYVTVDSATGQITLGDADLSGGSHPFNVADTQYFQNRMSAITPTAITAARETADANIRWDATNHTLTADYNLAAKNAAGATVYTELEYPITIPADKAYQAGYAAGGGGGSHAVTFGTLSYAVGTDLFKLPASCGDSTNTFNMTPSLGWSGAPNEWNTPQTNWMRVWRYIDLNGVASKDFAIDVDMTTQISGAYSSGHSAGYSSGYSAGSGAVTVSQVLGYGTHVARLELSNGSRWRIESDGTITRLN